MVNHGDTWHCNFAVRFNLANGATLTTEFSTTGITGCRFNPTITLNELSRHFLAEIDTILETDFLKRDHSSSD